MKKLRQDHLYGNCIMLSPDGTVLCRCDTKKINWYLSRNLATLIESDPPTIRLNFQPKGNGKSDYPYYTSSKSNVCVCCGSDKDLTKHHCVPRAFRKFFPKHYKSHNSHDIVLLCAECHLKYEAIANELKYELLGRKWHHVSSEEDVALRKASGYANAIIRHGEEMPLTRRNELEQLIKNYLKKDTLTLDDLNLLLEQDSERRNKVSEESQYGKKVVEEIADISEFIKMWRRHFVSKMNPQHLPKHWSVDHDDLSPSWMTKDDL